MLCLFIACVARFANDLLKTPGRIAYEIDLVWNGRTAHGRHRTSISALSFTTGLATIVFTVLLNGGVWIYSSQVQENGTAISMPKTESKIWNTLIMLAMLGTGVGAWGKGMSVRDNGNGSLGPNALSSWSNVLHHNQLTRIVYIAHEAIVVAASLSVAVEVLNGSKTTNASARGVRRTSCTPLCDKCELTSTVSRARTPLPLRSLRGSASLAARRVYRIRHRRSLCWHCGMVERSDAGEYLPACYFPAVRQFVDFGDGALGRVEDGEECWFGRWR